MFIQNQTVLFDFQIVLPLLVSKQRSFGVKRKGTRGIVLEEHAVLISCFRQNLTTLIRGASKKHGIEHSLVRAVIHVESGFNPRAVSPKGAVGLMQIMPFNHKMLGIKDPFNPAENIAGGVKFLARLIKHYKGNIRLALAAYNAGEDAVAKYNGVPPYTETKNYVKHVVELSNRYRKK